MEKITFITEDGGEAEIAARYEVCHTCRGTGSHVNPAIDGNGITQSEMDELGPDFEEDYFSGVYDVRCYECKGLRVTLVVDEQRADKALLAEYHAHQRAEWECAQMEAAERRMGA